MTEFVKWYRPGVELTLCQGCGALVGDEEQHIKWHEQQDQWIASVTVNAVAVEQSLQLLGKVTGLED